MRLRFQSMRPTATVSVAALVVSLLVGAMVPAPVQAQDLSRQIERLQQELKTLQGYVYNSGKVPAGSGAAAAGDLSKPQAARLELRLNQIDGQLRGMTGEVEQISFRINNLAKRMDELVADVDRRLQRLETGSGAPLAAADGTMVTAGQSAVQPSGPSTAQSAAQSAGLAATQAPASGQGAGQAAAGQPFDSGPKVLGSVAANDLEALRQQAQQSQTTQGQVSQGQVSQGQVSQAQATTTAQSAAASQTAALPGGTAKEQYDYAFGLLSQANYPEAEKALTAFLADHPRDPLAGNAKYWLGETHYVRGQFRDAAVIFAEGYQQYPNSAKAPDNLLKLGKSLASLSQTADACGTFAELLKRYPEAHPAIRQQAETEQTRIPCK